MVIFLFLPNLPHLLESLNEFSGLIQKIDEALQIASVN